MDCPSSNDMECGQFDDADVVCQGCCKNSTIRVDIPVQGFIVDAFLSSLLVS